MYISCVQGRYYIDIYICIDLGRIFLGLGDTDAVEKRTLSVELCRYWFFPINMISISIRYNTIFKSLDPKFRIVKKTKKTHSLNHRSGTVLFIDMCFKI